MKSHPRLLLSYVAAAALICLASSPLHADRFWIDPAGGLFNSVSNWSTSAGGMPPASVPGAADGAWFTLNNSYTVDFSAGTTNLSLEIFNGNVTFDLGGFTYSLTSTNAVTVGTTAGQTSRMTVTRGILGVDTNGDDVTIGSLAGSTGFLTVTAAGTVGTAALRPDLVVGAFGTGTLTVNENGRIDGTSFRVADNAGSTGTATITGPNAAAHFSGITIVGDSGTGTMSVTNGGTLTSGSIVTLGDDLGANGTATVTGVGSSWTIGGTSSIGDEGDGTLSISSGGRVSSAGAVTLGNLATGVGTATVTGSNSRWNQSGSQTIGSFGLGVMTVSSGGQVVSSSNAVLGSNAGSEGRVTVTGAGSQWTMGGALTVGNSGSGELTVSAGGEVSAASMTLASALFAKGVATVTGTGSKLATSGSVAVGNGTAAGTLSVASGAEVYVGANLTVTDRLNLDGGSIFVAGNLTNNNFVNFTDGLLQVKGNFQAASAPLQLTINGADNDDLPTLDLIGAGTTTNVAGITVGNNRRGRLLLRQGRSITTGGNDLGIGAAVGGEGFVSVQSGAFLGVGVAGALVVGGVGTTTGGTGTLDISGGTVSVVALRLFRDGTINLSGGGLLVVDSILALDGRFNWTNGTLRFNAPFTLSGANVPKLLGSDATMRAGQVLASNPGVAVTLQTPLVVDGGTLSASSLVNQSRLEVRSGSIGTVQNSGLIVGDGTIDGAVTNGAAGTIRVDAGEAIFFTGASNTNHGELNLQGGTLDFTSAVTNSATGRINGRGTLDFNGGLTNAGKMQFSGGPTDIFGNVTFTGGAGGGEMINSGGSNVVTFYDNVAHNGDEIRTSPTNTTVFFGNVTGAGPFTGTGAVRFEGTFSPGLSPAEVSMEGSAELSGDARLVMELRGTVPGDQHDQLNVEGLLSLGGTLDVTLLDGFSPRYGDEFDLFDYGTLAGRFDTIDLPALTGGLVWDTTALYSSGTIAAVPEPAGILLLFAGLACLLWRRRRLTMTCAQLAVRPVDQGVPVFCRSGPPSDSQATKRCLARNAQDVIAKHSHPSPACCLVIVLAWLSEPTLAANSIWDANGTNPPDGTFNVANNWNPNAVPGDADRAVFRFGAVPPYTITFPGARLFNRLSYHVNDQLRVGSNQVTFRSNLRAAYTLDNPATSEAGRGIIIGELPDDNAVLNNSLLTLTSAAATIGDAAGSEGTLNLNAGTFHVTGSSADHELIVGNSGKGTLNVGAGARLNVSGFNGNVILGNRSGSTGTVTVSGPGAIATISLIDVGGGLGNGTGTFDVTNGGQVTILDTTFGTIVFGLGTVNVDGAGSIWRNSGSFLLAGTLNITNGGTVSIDPEGNANMTIGGIVNVSGTDTTLTDGGLNVTAGEVNITAGGKVNSTSSDLVGSLTGVDTLVTVDGANSIWTNSGTLDILSNFESNSRVVVRNGGQVNSAFVRIQATGLGTSTLHVNSGARVIVSGSIDMAIDPDSTGMILVEGDGTMLTAPELYVGGDSVVAGGSGRLAVNGGMVNVDYLRIYGAGQVNVNGGTLDVAGTLTRIDGSVVHLDGGTLRLRNAAGLLAFPDTFEWTGGTLNLTESGLTVGAAGPFGSHLILNPRMNLQVAGALDVNSGAQLVGTGGLLSGGTGLNNGTISVIGGSLSYSQPAVNNGNLDAIRATLTFPGDGIKNAIGLTNNDTLTLANVTVNGDVHSPTGSTINVAAGVVFNGLVSGGGSFPGAGTVTFNGGFSPGDSPAAVTFNGGVELGPSAALEMELGGTMPGSEYDQLDVAGLLSIDGTLVVSLLNQFQPSLGYAFDLFDYSALDGRFDAIQLPPLPAGRYWDTSELYSTGTISVSAVPEPAAVCIWITASICVGAVVCRRWQGCRLERGVCAGPSDLGIRCSVLVTDLTVGAIT